MNNLKTNLDIDRIISVKDYIVLLRINKGGNKEHVVMTIDIDGNLFDGHYFMDLNNDDHYDALSRATKLFDKLTK